MKNKSTLVYFLIFSSILLHAQSASVGNWTMFFNQTRLNDKWSLSSDLQFRSYDIRPNTEQLMVRVGGNFHYNQHVTLTAGYAWATNYIDNEEIIKPQYINENRLWEQVLLKHNLGRLLVENRFRLEQRWMDINHQMNYKNRIRYLFRTIIPINKKELAANTLFLNLYDEIFIYSTTSPFDRNRLYTAIGFQFNSVISTQLGYMFQTVGSVTKQYLQFGIYCNFDLRKK
jgi:hypothetical protein